MHTAKINNFQTNENWLRKQFSASSRLLCTDSVSFLFTNHRPCSSPLQNSTSSKIWNNNISLLFFQLIFYSLKREKQNFLWQRFQRYQTTNRTKQKQQQQQKRQLAPNVPAIYQKCCILIGYATRYLDISESALVSPLPSSLATAKSIRRRTTADNYTSLKQGFLASYRCSIENLTLE